VAKHKKSPCFRDNRGWNRERGYGLLRDVLKGARAAFGEAWGDNKRYMVTRDVTLKAIVRLAGDLAAGAKEHDPKLEPKALARRFEGWSEHVRDFRREGFYERFAAKGQAERVEKIRRYLAREAKLES
jgi:hypothetical protein